MTTNPGLTFINRNEDGAFQLLMGIFLGFMIMALINGVKLAQIGPFVFDGGLLLYAMTFVVIDITAEVYGRGMAQRIIQTGFWAMISTFVALQFAFLLPSSSEWGMEKEYQDILGQGLRTIFAGLISYIVTQYVDLKLFTWVRAKTQGRHLWLRSLCASASGGVLDAIIFTSIAFYGVHPVGEIIQSAIIVRLLFNLIMTPMVYGGVWSLRHILGASKQETLAPSH